MSILQTRAYIWKEKLIANKANWSEFDRSRIYQLMSTASNFIMKNVNILLQKSITNFLYILKNGDVIFNINCGHWICVGVFYYYFFIYSMTFCIYVHHDILLHCSFLWLFVILCNLSLIFEKMKKKHLNSVPSGKDKTIKTTMHISYVC